METQQIDQIHSNKVQKRRADIIATLSMFALIVATVNTFSNITNNNYGICSMIDNITFIASLLTIMYYMSSHQSKITDITTRYGISSIVTIVCGTLSAFLSAHYHITKN
ncbi:MAG: hypothetical protein Homavirus12_4 [Homavirus sp.]|uniref:Uncharacterized protein n=1 Tax=Homavirus sp. TaxID=2487769 RepID=A0A3G5A4J6_9VIRU|nr:MAG: hypothetical protein Homavirus12_4 [Homavirus sp.]